MSCQAKSRHLGLIPRAAHQSQHYHCHPDQAFFYYRHPDQAKRVEGSRLYFPVPRTSRGTNTVTLSAVERSRLLFLHQVATILMSGLTPDSTLRPGFLHFAISPVEMT
nr:MAG TPA: hypothetical protein [Caudoviricetes sp.]